VTWDDIYLTAAIGGAILSSSPSSTRELLFTAYDPAMAAASNSHCRLSVCSSLLVALTTVIAIQTIVSRRSAAHHPAATAQLLVQHPAIMPRCRDRCRIFLSAYMSAWHADLSASASIVLTATALFILAFAFAPVGHMWNAGVVPGRR
jgi:ABC-type Mn2+/Zn2+ transport system permease subunit